MVRAVPSRQTSHPQGNQPEPREPHARPISLRCRTQPLSSHVLIVPDGHLTTRLCALVFDPLRGGGWLDTWRVECVVVGSGHAGILAAGPRLLQAYAIAGRTH